MDSNTKQVHIHVSGEDRPGILAEALESIVGHHWDVLDIKQFVFNGMLNLSLLLEVKSSDTSASIESSLSEYASRSGVKVGVHPWQSGYRPDASYKFRSVVTMLGYQIQADLFLQLTRTLASRDINILRIEQLDYGDQHVIEMLIGTREEHSTVDMLNALVQFKEQFQVDLAVQEDNFFRTNKRLIVFDADMTFLQCEVIDELGKMAGAGERMAQLTHQAMNGEIDFRTALQERVRLLKGLPVEHLQDLFNRIPLTPGAEDLVRILKHLGYKIAIVSGGFQFFIEKLRQKYGLDHGFANKLQITDGKVTGELDGDIIDAEAKEQILVSLAEEEGLTLRQVVAVGDGANDINMLASAGLGIAFNAKPIVQQAARASINRSNLELILYFLGISGKELQELREVIRQAGPTRVVS